MLLPAEPNWLLQLVIAVWLLCFVLTFGSYLLLLAHRIGLIRLPD